MTRNDDPRWAVIPGLNNEVGGLMFAYMMSRVDRRIGATHYTLLATVEVAGKLLASAASGFLAQHLGFSDTFALATALAVAFLGLLIPLQGTHSAQPAG